MTQLRRMRLMRNAVIAVLVIGVALICVRLFLNSSDPVYQGARLSTRFQEISESYPPDAAAAEALLRHKPQAIRMMCRKLGARDPKWKIMLTRWAGKQSLIGIKFSTAAEQHVQGMAACKLLGADAAPAIPILTNWLYDPGKAWDGARCLSYIGPESTPHLAAVVRSEAAPPVCRQNGVIALARMRPVGESVIPLLIGCLGDTNFGVRSAAASALTNVAATSSAVAPALITSMERSTSVESLTWSAVALKGLSIRAHAAVPTLLRMTQHKDWGVSANSMSALAAIDKETARPILADWLLTGDGLKPVVAIQEFAHYGESFSQDIVPLFLKALDSRDELVRERIIHVLGEMGNRASDAVPRLSQAERDPSPKVRAAATNALAKIRKD